MSKQITKAIEDYIEAIYILEKDSSSIKSIDISKLLNVSINYYVRFLLQINI